MIVLFYERTIMDQRLKNLRRDIFLLINNKLKEVFELINYQTPFTVKVSAHAIERIVERIQEKGDGYRLGKMFQRIADWGVCELLYLQTRYSNGENVKRMEFYFDDMIIPFTFVADFCVLRTVMIASEGEEDAEENRGKYVRINLGNDRFKNVGVI